MFDEICENYIFFTEWPIFFYYKIIISISSILTSYGVSLYVLTHCKHCIVLFIAAIPKVFALIFFIGVQNEIVPRSVLLLVTGL